MPIKTADLIHAARLFNDRLYAEFASPNEAADEPATWFVRMSEGPLSDETASHDSEIAAEIFEPWMEGNTTDFDNRMCLAELFAAAPAMALKLEEIRAVLYLDGPDTEWDADTCDAIARIVRRKD